MGIAQTKKPTATTKKTSTTVKSNVPKTTTIKKTTTTTTTTRPVVLPPVVEEKKTTTTTTTITTPTETKTTITPSSTTTTTTTQSSGPSKGKKVSEPKPEKVRESKPERVRESKPERVREPKPERVRTPRELNGSSGGVRFGIRAEANQFVSFEQGAGLEFSPGFNAGIIVNLPLSEKIAIQPEVLYSMASVKANIGVAGDYLKYTAGSILTPVLLNINLGNGSTKFMINLGGYAEYALSASSEESTSGVRTTMSGDLTGLDRFFYGVAGGIGVKLNNKFMIETRSFYDLKTANSNSIFTTLGIGYMF
jgi:hypothetical protein